MAGMVARNRGAAMTVTISLDSQDVFKALRTFLIAVLPANTPVVQAQDNSVPMPTVGFVAMNNIGLRRLSTNTNTYHDTGDNPGTRDAMTATEYTMQVDCYGSDSGEWASIIQSLFRDDYGFNLFPDEIKPLYADDPVQMPLINGEQQYEQRWRIKAVMQYNPEMTVPQDFFDTLPERAVEMKPVDVLVNLQ